MEMAVRKRHCTWYPLLEEAKSDKWNASQAPYALTGTGTYLQLATLARVQDRAQYTYRSTPAQAQTCWSE
jgi:hypothetical protein